MKKEYEIRKDFDLEELSGVLRARYADKCDVARSLVSEHFEGILTSFQLEDEELKKQISFHERSLNSARGRRREVRSILGVLVWLSENLFATEEFKMGRAVRRALFVGDGTAYSTYRMLMERLNNFVGQDPPLHPPKPERNTTPEEEIPFWCPECGLGFRDEDDFELHKATMCDYCGDAAFKRKRDAAEGALEEDKKLRCAVCGYKAKTVGGLATHMRKHRNFTKGIMKTAAKSKRRQAKKKVAKRRG